MQRRQATVETVCAQVQYCVDLFEAEIVRIREEEKVRRRCEKLRRSPPPPRLPLP
jgi:hypothetical protein